MVRACCPDCPECRDYYFLPLRTRTFSQLVAMWLEHTFLRRQGHRVVGHSACQAERHQHRAPAHQSSLSPIELLQPSTSFYLHLTLLYCCYLHSPVHPLTQQSLTPAPYPQKKQTQLQLELRTYSRWPRPPTSSRMLMRIAMAPSSPFLALLSWLRT